MKSWAEVEALGLRLPGAEPGTSYGTPALKVRGKLLLRYRPDLEALVIFDIAPDERDLLVAAAPETWFFTDHYRDYDIALARLAAIGAEELGAKLERRWRRIAGKRLLAGR